MKESDSESTESLLALAFILLISVSSFTGTLKEIIAWNYYVGVGFELITDGFIIYLSRHYYKKDKMNYILCMTFVLGATFIDMLPM